MTDSDPDLHRLLAPLREPNDAAMPAIAPSPEARARLLAAMRAEVRAVPARRQRATNLRRLTFAAPVLLAAAASFALLYQGRSPVLPEARGSVHVAATGTLSWSEHDHKTRSLRGEGELQGDGELDVPAETSAALTTLSGVHITAEPRTRLRLQTVRAGVAQRVLLRAGALHCQVPPLGKGRSFVVDTARASVVVHGTDFRVEQGTSSDQAPCVRVSEGLVEVQRANEDSVWLGPGNSWNCDLPAPATPASATAASRAEPVAALQETTHVAPAPRERHGAASVRAHKSARGRASVRRPQRDHAAPLESTLERENSLLAQALQAEQQGDSVRARALFQSLLASFPRSPLAPEARAGLLRTHAR